MKITKVAFTDPGIKNIEAIAAQKGKDEIFGEPFTSSIAAILRRITRLAILCICLIGFILCLVLEPINSLPVRMALLVLFGVGLWKLEVKVDG